MSNLFSNLFNKYYIYTKSQNFSKLNMGNNLINKKN